MEIERENITEVKIWLTLEDMQILSEALKIVKVVEEDSYHRKTRFIVEVSG